MEKTYHVLFNNLYYTIIPQNGNSEIPISNANTIVLQNPSEQEIIHSIELLDKEQKNNVTLVANNAPACWDIFKSHFIHIQAGGGLVKNEKSEYLFIFRRGKWDLPKGKLDEGETLAECALREVCEETGLQNITLREHIGSTWHVYHEKGKNVLKESVWFNMECNSNQQLIPQTEEDILEIKWLKKEQWQMVLQNTYLSIKEVLTSVS